MVINNIPDYAKNYTYLVARDDDKSELWFWGAYNDLMKAQDAAKEIKGQVYMTKHFYFMDGEN